MAKIDQMLGEKKKTSVTELTRLVVNGKTIPFEIDTGSRFTVINFEDYKKLFYEFELKNINVPLTVVSGERLKVMGKIKVTVWVKKIRHEMEMIVIKTTKDFIPLMGREWLNELCPRSLGVGLKMKRKLKSCE
jgi:predicted aspartyl protease